MGSERSTNCHPKIKEVAILHRSAVQWLHTLLLRTAPSMIKVVQKCDPCDYQSWLQAGKSGEIQRKTLGWHWWAGVVSTRSLGSPYFNIQGFNKPTQRQTVLLYVNKRTCRNKPEKLHASHSKIDIDKTYRTQESWFLHVKGKELKIKYWSKLLLFSCCSLTLAILKNKTFSFVD